MKLDGFLRGTQFVGDLLVEHTGNNARHHFAFARRERFVTPARIRQLPLQLPRGAVAFNGLLDGVEQVLLTEWLGEKFDRACFHRLDRHRDVPMPRDEDDRDFNARPGQFALQIETAQRGQTHVEHQARRRIRAPAAQKFRRCSERLDVETRRPDQALGGPTKRRIIVNDDDDGIGLTHDLLKGSIRDGCQQSHVTFRRQNAGKRGAGPNVQRGPQPPTVSLYDGEADA